MKRPIEAKFSELQKAMEKPIDMNKTLVKRINAALAEATSKPAIQIKEDSGNKRSKAVSEWQKKNNAGRSVATV